MRASATIAVTSLIAAAIASAVTSVRAELPEFSAAAHLTARVPRPSPEAQPQPQSQDPQNATAGAETATPAAGSIAPSPTVTPAAAPAAPVAAQPAERAAVVAPPAPVPAQRPARVAAPSADSSATAAASAPLGCPAGSGRLPVTRLVTIDAAAGQIYGDITRRSKEPNFLRPKEVVLTFDDGPMPWITKSILDTLDRYCAKATFFEVGRMAVAYPGMVREVLARGHTIGGHTWSHPFNLPHMKPEKAHEEIEKGLSAISLAAGQPVAPFFRFTGLGDSDPLLNYLQGRGIASFTVDVVSDDSYINDANKLANITLQRIEAKGGGIVLFHDIKAATAKALPVILAGLADRGYRIVHMAAANPVQPLKEWDASLAPVVAKAIGTKGEKPRMLPFYGAVGPERMPEMTALAPEPRARSTAQPPSRVAMGPRQRAAMGRSSRSMMVASPGAASTGASSSSWATEIRPQRSGGYPY